MHVLLQIVCVCVCLSGKKEYERMQCPHDARSEIINISLKILCTLVRRAWHTHDMPLHSDLRSSMV